MVRTFAVAQFLLSVKSLAAKTIQTAVFAEIDIARFVHPREDFLNETNVIGVSGPDKVVIGDPAVIPDAAKGSAYTIGELFRGDIRLCCDLRDLVTMFVSAREVKRLIPLGAVVPRKGIRDHHRIRATQMWLGIDVKQRRCNVYWFHQRPLTAPNKNFSSTMRRFKLRWMRAAAPAVCERAESLWLTLLLVDRRPLPTSTLFPYTTPFRPAPPDMRPAGR